MLHSHRQGIIDQALVAFIAFITFVTGAPLQAFMVFIPFMAAPLQTFIAFIPFMAA